MKVFLSLGSNLGNSKQIIKEALALLKELPNTHDFLISDVYDTTPVSEIEQANFLNAACSFQTSYTLLELFEKIQQIEKLYGTKSAKKNAPRHLDIDILFFGELQSKKLPCYLPHPRWKERLFVLKPLSDITKRVPFEEKSIEQILEEFTNPHNETVRSISHEKKH